MNNQVTLGQVVARLEENKIDHALLALQNNVLLVVSRRGGRIFGPFLPRPDPEESESIFWTNGVFTQQEGFEEFLASGDWNLGGERIWMAPEIQYSVHDRSDFWGTLDWPEQVDPGNYVVEKLGDSRCTLSQHMTLEAHNVASGKKTLHLERLIQPAADPLRSLRNYEYLVDGVLYAGYEHVVTLSEGEQNDIMSEAWSLVQLNPGGILIIPASPRIGFVDYYEPAGSLQTFHGDHVRLQITGRDQYKLGYKASHVTGRIGYLNRLEDGRAYLIVRSFYNNPSRPYTEEPAHLPGWNGYSVHVYNDDENAGGFGEMECNCQTIGGKTGRSTSRDELMLWLYVGAEEKVREIGVHLLGVSIG
ncbi:MAG: hypothetical protein PVH50_01785 [Anaerolineae bacterium]